MSYGDINPRPRRRSHPDQPAPDNEASDERSPDGPDKGGYGRPPKQHRWKKGVSGNPKGKTPGTKSLHTLIERELDVVLEVTERGKKRKYTKRRVAAMRIVNKAVEGDDKSLTVLLRREGNMQVAAPSAAPSSDETLSSNEQSILDHFWDAARLAAERKYGQRDA
jgi:hypothetical protein